MQKLGVAVVMMMCATVCSVDAQSANNGLCPEGTPRKVEALFDQPLRDTSVCRGPDGIYYLTGTSGTKQADGSVDFENNDGIWLWRSADLKQWEAIGHVWRIGGDGDPQFRKASTWQIYQRAGKTDADAQAVRGMTAPEIHYLRDTFYITYSMNGHGTGLLKSESGRAEGPYIDLGRITRSGGEASLFEDDDGTVYWVWGEGWIARMNDNLTGLAEEPRLLRPECEVEGGTWPMTMGQGGAFLFKAPAPGHKQGEYHLVAYDTIPRMGPVPCRDTYIATAKSVYGPYSRRDLMIPHGGQVTIFQTPEGDAAATFSGVDAWAAVRDRPAIVPLVPHATEFGADYWWCGAFTKPWYPVSEAGAWSEMNPFVTEGVQRDVSVLNAPDGSYYLTYTDMLLNKRKQRAPREKIGVQVWRSKDMANWEDMGLLWRCDDSPRTKAGLDKVIEVDHYAPILYDIEMLHIKGTYWIVGCMQTGRKWFERGGMHLLILRSTSGKAEGPYEDHWQGPHTPDLWTPSLLEDDDGSVYIVGGGIGRNIGKLNDDMTDLATDLWQVEPARNHKLGEGGHLIKIGDTYIHTTAVWHGADPYDHGMSKRGRVFSTYDLMYCTAKDLRGPWSATRCAAPKCGNARPFQDKEGNWFAPFFGNHYFGPWSTKPGAYPLIVREEDGDVFLEAMK